MTGRRFVSRAKPLTVDEAAIHFQDLGPMVNGIQTRVLLVPSTGGRECGKTCSVANKRVVEQIQIHGTMERERERGKYIVELKWVKCGSMREYGVRSRKL